MIPRRQQITTEICTVLPYKYAPLSYEWMTANEATDIIYIHRRKFAQFVNAGDVDGEGFIVSLLFINSLPPISRPYSLPVRIGGFHVEEPDIIYAPPWMIEDAGLHPGEINEAIISTYDTPVPPATKIQLILTGIGAELYGPETKEIYEAAIGSYGCIQAGSKMRLYLAELNLIAEAIVSEVEPAAIVRFNGEVEVDIIGEEQEPVGGPIIPQHILKKLEESRNIGEEVVVAPPTVNINSIFTPEERRAAIRAAWASKIPTPQLPTL